MRPRAGSSSAVGGRLQGVIVQPDDDQRARRGQDDAQVSPARHPIRALHIVHLGVLAGFQPAQVGQQMRRGRAGVTPTRLKPSAAGLVFKPLGAQGVGQGRSGAANSRS